MRTDELTELARRQHGVFARWQALALGFSHYYLSRRLDAGDLRVVMGGVLAAASSELDQCGQDWAGYLAAGPGAVLSGPSALARHGMEVTRDAVWVTVPAERHVSLPGLRTIREALPSEDITELATMRVTSRARSVVDCLRVLPGAQAQPLLDRALLWRWLTVDDLAVWAAQLAGRRGVGRVRVHIDRVRPGARSEAKRIAIELLLDAGITGWKANLEVRDENGVVRAIVDLGFEKEKVAVEIDGLAHHTDPERFQRDRTRQNWLVQNGWNVLRFTWDDLMRRPGYVIAAIRAALQRPRSA